MTYSFVLTLSITIQTDSLRDLILSQSYFEFKSTEHRTIENVPFVVVLFLGFV